MKRHRLAFVGAGRIADVHYASIQAMPERAQLVAFCDNRTEALVQRKAQWDVPGFKSFDLLMRDIDPDAVCLFLPHNLHLQYVTAAARAGKPVFMEKPVAGTREDARKIIDVVAETGIQLLVTHTGLFHPAFQRILEFIRKGWLGRPLFAKGTSAGWLTFRPWDFRLSREQTGGGCWVDAGGHLVYCLREIFGEVDSVTGYIARLSRPEMEGEDHAAATLRYRSGALAQLFVSYGHKLPGYQHDWPIGYLNSIEISGDKGAVQYVISPEPRVSYFSEVAEAMPQEWQGWLTHQPPEGYGYSFQAALAHFLDCLDTGAKPRVTAEDGLATLDTLLRLYEHCQEIPSL
jgi:UDP-N-acetyl-2-amino-2-deoxyglucuronate dehydrogenase